MTKNLRIHDQTIFFIGLTGVLSGIFLTNIFHESAVFIVVLLIILIIPFVFFYPKYIKFIIFFLFANCVGGILSYHRFAEVTKHTNILERSTVFFTREVRIRGTITEKVSETTKSVRYILRGTTLWNEQIPPHIGIIASFQNPYNIRLGDAIAFTGRISLPASNGRFDYRTYLLLRDTYGTVPVGSFEKIGTDNPSIITVILRSVREKILGGIVSIYPGESANLLGGILIGERSELSPDTKQHFNNSGLTHIVAVSGFNITVILIFLSFLLKTFPRSVQIVVAAVCVGFFTLLVWPQISVLRASMFWLIAYIILLSGRKTRAFPILLGVGIVFVVLDPLILNYDVSFHLSFLAVFWLLFFGDFFERKLSWVPRFFAMRESLAMTLSAMVFTLPILLINFWQLSIIAPIANIAVVPTIPFVMLLGGLSLLISPLSHYASVMIGFPSWILLEYILSSVDFFGGLSFSTVAVDFGQFQYVFELGYFGLLIFLLLFMKSERVDGVDAENSDKWEKVSIKRSL